MITMGCQLEIGIICCTCKTGGYTSPKGIVPRSVSLHVFTVGEIGLAKVRYMEPGD